VHFIVGLLYNINEPRLKILVPFVVKSPPICYYRQERMIIRRFMVKL